MMARFSDLYDYVLSKCRGVDPPMVDFYIRQIGRDFLQATTLWRESIPITLRQGMTEYRLVPLQGGLIAGIRNMPRVDDPSRTMNELNENTQRPAGYVSAPGQPDGYWETFPGTFSINRPPDQDYPILVDVFKKLSLDPDDDYFPDDVLDHHAEALAAGVVARLQSMGAVPWRDTQMATINYTEYTKEKFAVRSRLRNGSARNNQRVAAPRFAGRNPATVRR
jgi:hypothetical protein